MNNGSPFDQLSTWLSSQPKITAVGASLGIALGASLLVGIVVFLWGYQPGLDKETAKEQINSRQRFSLFRLIGYLITLSTGLILIGSAVIGIFAAMLAPILLLHALNLPILIASPLGAIIGIVLVLFLGMFVDGLPLRKK